MSAKVKLPDPLDKLLRSQLEKVIEEAAFHTDDELIARRRIIDKWNQIDVAAELGWYRSEVLQFWENRSPELMRETWLMKRPSNIWLHIARCQPPRWMLLHNAVRVSAQLDAG